MKRRLITIAIFLLAGAVVNVAVAWGLTFLAVPSPGVPSLFLKLGTRLYGYQHTTAFGREYVELTLVSGGVTLQRDVVFSDKELIAAAFPSWMRVGPTRQWSNLTAASAYGWPQLTLWLASEGRDSWVHVLPSGTDHRLPPTPLWPGFTINTLFYAALLWLLIPGPFALRRFLRLRRGLCPKCAYPMGESAVCSECGKPLSGQVGCQRETYRNQSPPHRPW